jgi:hypothetical protein
MSTIGADETCTEPSFIESSAAFIDADLLGILIRITTKTVTLAIVVQHIAVACSKLRFEDVNVTHIYVVKTVAKVAGYGHVFFTVTSRGKDKERK